MSESMSYNRIMDSQEQIQAIRALTAEIPLNDFGMPTGVYRTDLLPYHDYRPGAPKGAPKGAVNGRGNGVSAEGLIDLTPEASRDPNSLTTELAIPGEQETTADVYRIAGFPAVHLQQAFMPLQFDEGFPAFDNGQPFWGRLDFEPADAFEAFQQYLRMSLGKPSTLEGAGEDEEYDGRDASGTRNISMLVAGRYNDREILVMTQKYQEYFHLYYWGMRAHAYDLYRIAQYRTQQELRAVETQDEHYVQARRLRHRLTQYMADEEEFWDMMTPKTAIDMFTKVTSLERISAGMPASGPIPENTESNRGKPFEVTLRSVAQTNRRGEGKVISEDGEVLDKALEDPEATEVLQELIIRAGGN